MPRSDPQGNILDYGAGLGAVRGHYRVEMTCSLAAGQAANSILAAMRWGDASGRLMVIERLEAKVFQLVAATTAAVHAVQFQVCRSFTASDTAGAAVSLAGNNAKMRTNMASSLVTDLRVSTVAAGLTAGTRTPDGTQFMACPFTNQAAVNPIVYEAAAFSPEDNRHPLVFAQDEGWEAFLIAGLSGPSDGNNLYITMEWAEVDGY